MKREVGADTARRSIMFRAPRISMSVGQLDRISRLIPGELRSLLSERFDAIRVITVETIETTARVTMERSGLGNSESEA